MIKIIILIFCPLFLFSQIGGENSFSFLNTETSPRIVACGGQIIALIDQDVSASQSTPSLINNSMHNNVVFNYSDYLSDINILSAHYARSFSNFGTIALSLNTIDYGDFIYTDDSGSDLGTFSASDQIITIGGSKELSKQFIFGINFRILNSYYENFYSLALSSNISTTYYNQKHAIVATLLFKNIGRQLISYSIEEEYTPFEIQCGISKRLKHLPFTYIITLHTLNIFDISNNFFPELITDPVSQNLVVQEESFGKKLLRHVIIGGELNPFNKSVYIRGGFNFQKRFDMHLSNKPYATGFSWGVGLEFSRFEFNFSQSVFHISGIINNFSIATNLSNFGIK